MKRRARALWARLKARYWDETPGGVETGGNVAIFSGPKAPPLRRMARWFAAQWDKSPAAWISAAAAVTVVIIALLRH